MIAWPVGVNTNAYGLETTPKENVERIEFESGKSRTYLKNSGQKLIMSFILSVEDVGPNSEYKKFLEWWKDDLLSGSLSFGFPDLITHTGITEYLMLSSFSVDGQKRKEITLTVEEV